MPDSAGRALLATVLLVAASCSAPQAHDSDAADLADTGCSENCADAGQFDGAIVPHAGGDAGETDTDAGKPQDAGEIADAGLIDAGSADAGCPWECGENELCVPDHRKCVCASDFHDCNGNCVPDDALTSCGGRCSPCPTAVANAVGACVGRQCSGDFVCNSGFHRCGDVCLPDDSVASCGSRCEPCPETANSAAICEAGSCGLECFRGNRLCNGACAACPAGATATACDGAACVATACEPRRLACGGGTLCAACPSANVASVRCEADRCVVDSCAPGFHQCGGACVPDDAVTSCGSRCDPCPVDPNGRGTTSCVAGQCAIACPSPTLLCGGACSWCGPAAGAASLGCNGFEVCAPLSCAPGHYSCSRGCCPDQFQTFEMVGVSAGAITSAFGFDLDSLGRPHVVWIGGDHATGFTLNHSVRDSSGWQTAPLVQLAASVWTVKLEVDFNDVPHVVYWGPNSPIHYATRPAGNWVHENVPIAGPLVPQLAVDPSGQPLIVTSSDYGLVLLRRGSQGWSHEQIDTGPMRLPVAFSVEPAGTLHVLYSAGTTNGRFIPTHARRDTMGWSLTEVAQEDALVRSIAVTAAGIVHATYETTGATPAVRHAERSTTGVWTSTHVASISNGLGEGGSIAVTQSGQPVVGLSAPVTGYAARTALGWNIQSADPWVAISRTRLRLDAADRVHLLYLGFNSDAWFKGLPAFTDVLMYVH